MRLLAVAALRAKPILLVEQAQDSMTDYLVRLAQQGRMVIATTTAETLLAAADQVVELFQ